MLPNGEGTSSKSWFILTKDFWLEVFGEQVLVTGAVDLECKNVAEGAVEEVDWTLKQRSKKKAMFIRNLRNKFSKKAAVDSLDLTIYEG